MLGPLAYKTCPVCTGLFPLEQFPKQAIGRFSRHTYCRKCYNAKRRDSNRKVYDKEVKRKWNFKSRYGLSEADVNEMHRDQNGSCALCGIRSEKLKIDHDHRTDKVRKLICHRCNLRMSAVDDEEWCEKAILYRDSFR